MFDACDICGTDDWRIIYRGPVRDGSFGYARDDASVGVCGCCGVERLAESLCKNDLFYETAEYRDLLGQSTDASVHFSQHDPMQIFTLQHLWPRSLRGCVIADIGCTAGSLLDHIGGPAERVIAVEPCVDYHPVLRERGYRVYAYAEDAMVDFAGQLDFAFSIQVIEHVRDPRCFLKEIRGLLKPSGMLMISTPNRRDVLTELLPEDFRSFFYRTVHRWYFDADSLRQCALLAGFTACEIGFVHKFGISNAMGWLRDRKPTGRVRLPHMNDMMDKMWRGYLEREGIADTLYALLSQEPENAL